MKIRVPEAMLKAALDAKEMPHRREYEETVRPALEAALRWLSENPIVPTDEQVSSMLRILRDPGDQDDNAQGITVEWQRVMFMENE